MLVHALPDLKLFHQVHPELLVKRRAYPAVLPLDMADKVAWSVACAQHFYQQQYICQPAAQRRLLLDQYLHKPPLGRQGPVPALKRVAFLLTIAELINCHKGDAIAKMEKFAPAFYRTQAIKECVLATLDISTTDRQRLLQIRPVDIDDKVWHRHVSGALAEARVAQAFLENGCRILFPTPEEDVHCQMDWLVPLANESDGWCLQVKRRANLRGVHCHPLMANSDFPEFLAFVQDVDLRINQAYGLRYRPALIEVGSDFVLDEYVRFGSAVDVASVRNFLSA